MEALDKCTKKFDIGTRLMFVIDLKDNDFAYIVIRP